MSQDTLTLTVRLHDPQEKTYAEKSTQWAVLEIPREDLLLPRVEFFARHLNPALDQIIANLLKDVEA